MLDVLFFLSIALILYSYGGYYGLLVLFSFFKKKPAISENLSSQDSFPLRVSVIIAAYNEEKVIESRIENLLDQKFPQERMEIIVASDGSSDNTVKIVSQYKDAGVKVLDFKERRGRASVHNDAVDFASGDIVVFTDAGTVFKEDLLQNVVQDFKDDKIGGVAAKLIYLKGNEPISETENIYLRFELKLRELESRTGILSLGSGACLSIRKDIFLPIKKNEDVDDIFPLQCLRSGFRMYLDPKVVAYDRPPSSINSEIRARIRMTAQGFRGTVRNWGWKDIVNHPAVTWGLISHKILRWLTPYLMILAYASNLFLIHASVWFLILSIVQTGFYFFALIGLLGYFFKKRMYFASTIFSFCVANLGIMIGVLKGSIGRAPATYE